MALAGVDLRVAPGEHVALIGPSGAGKSSLLAALAGSVPAGGRMRVAGRVARIRQDLALSPRRSALANVLDGARGEAGTWGGLRLPADARPRARALIERVGLGHRVHARVDRLSGGEAQRVAIARALMRQPDVLLADEPVASLDPVNARAIMDLLDELRRERGLTLVCVLHDHGLAHACADRVVALDSGRVAEERAQPSTPAGTNRTGEGALRDALDPTPRPGARPGATPPPSALPALAFWALAAVALIWSVGVLADDIARFQGSLGAAFSFLGRLVPSAGEWATIDWAALGSALVETLRMSILGTAGSVVLALPLGALAARTVTPRWLGAPVRAFLNVWRAIPSIVWALLFVSAVGLGVMAGVIALIAYSMGYLTKFFYEAFEGVDAAAPSALRELGVGPAGRFVHAVWPAAAPALAGACLFMLEYNVRAASVLGLVGAGGIGHDLKLAAEWSNWHVAGAILMLLAATVLVVDWLSARLRERLA